MATTVNEYGQVVDDDSGNIDTYNENDGTASSTAITDATTRYGKDRSAYTENTE